MWIQSWIQMPKPPVKSASMRVRVYPEELVAWRRLARADAMTLSTWIRVNLNVLCKRPKKLAAGRRVASA